MFVSACAIGFGNFSFLHVQLGLPNHQPPSQQRFYLQGKILLSYLERLITVFCACVTIVAEAKFAENLRKIYKLIT